MVDFYRHDWRSPIPYSNYEYEHLLAGSRLLGHSQKTQRTRRLIYSEFAPLTLPVVSKTYGADFSTASAFVTE